MSDLQDRLAALRRRYAATLPAAVAKARAAFDRMPEAGALEEVWQTVHQIYGTAGSYGIEGVASAAHRVEEALLPHRQATALPPAVAEAVAADLEALGAQADLAART